MARLRYGDLARKPLDVLDMTSLTRNEFQTLVPPFEAAFQTHMTEWRLDGKPRTARRFTTYTNCPLPTPEDRLLFILVYLKTHPLQVAHGVMFGLPQGKTNQWLHVLLLMLQTALRQLGDAPSRFARRRVRIEHVNSSVKRCRIVKDTIRIFREGARDMVAEICCALHNFRVRLSPWKPMI